jgi:acyl-CoA thioester hydrolase
MSEGPPLGGVLDGRLHRLPVRVYYEDTDTAGIVYYANYFKFMERGRSEFLRAIGVAHPDRMEGREGDPVGFVVRRAVADYFAPAKLGDLLEVETCVTKVTGATLTMRQDVRREGNLLVAGEVTAAIVGRDGRPRPLPRHIRHILDTLVWSDPAPRAGSIK